METEKTLNANDLNKIIDRAKQNDREAIAVLIEYFYHKIRTYIFYRVNNKEDTEDLIQEVFLRMVKSLENQKSNFTAWLYKIASNLVIDFYRHRAIQKEVPLDEIKEIEINGLEYKYAEKGLNQEQFKRNLTQLTDE